MNNPIHEAKERVFQPPLCGSGQELQQGKTVLLSNVLSPADKQNSRRYTVLGTL